MLTRLSELDAFPKTLDEFAVRTKNGGVVTLVGISICMLLFVGQLWDFILTRHPLEEVVVDSGTLQETLAIHFDITFPRMSCSKFAMATVDAAGLEKSMLKQNVFKLSLDKDGYAVGHAVQQDGSEQTMLYKQELKKKHDDHQQSMPKENDQHKPPERKPQHTACGSCYGVDGVSEPMKCCNSCTDVRNAFQFRGWEWRADGEDRFWQCREEHVWSKVKSDAEHRELENKPEHGCEVFGSIFVAKAKGSFHFGVTQAILGTDLVAMLFEMKRDIVPVDMSHQIHSLWFGGTVSNRAGGHEYEPPEVGLAALSKIDSNQGRKHRDPLLGMENKLEEASTVQYNIKVVGTDVVFLNGSVVSCNQYSATENVRAVHMGTLPSLHFFYDTSPLRLRFTETTLSWAELHTNMLALTGGIFAFMGIVDSLVHKNKLSSLNKIVHEKMVMARKKWSGQ